MTRQKFNLILTLAVMLTMAQTAWATDIILSGSDSYTAQDGDVLKGTTSGTVTIANNATITLSDAAITGGIVCAGTAEITLAGTNSVSNTWYSSAGIQIGGSGTTLTIKGNGSLSATGGSAAAGIGLGRTWDANATGGSIVIEGGTVTASGDIGIGIGTVGSSGAATIGDIVIKGGTVNASLGKGYIYSNNTATISAIKIHDTIDKVDASKITESVTYMHDNSDVTATASTYFTIIEDGDRRIIEKKDDTDYTITIADGIEHGTIAYTATTAKYGDKITITATPDFGYRLSRLVVKDAQNNDVASTGNSFFMPKSNVTVSAVFEQGTHGTTEFKWSFLTGPHSEVEETIYDGVTTVNIQQTERTHEIRKYEDEYGYSRFLLDNDTYGAEIPYSGGTGAFYKTGNGTYFSIPVNGETGFYDITMTDAGNGKWSVSILKTAAVIDDIPDQTYTGSAITPEPLVLAGSLSLTKGTDYEYSYTNNTNVGTSAKVTVTFIGDYASLGSVEKEFTITKATPTVTAPTAIADLVYTGSAQALVTGGTTDVGDILSYCLEENGTYSADIPTGTNAGTYTVYYKVDGSDNWNAVAGGTVEVPISPKAVTVTAEAKSKEYGAADPELTATVEGLVGEDAISYTVSRTAGEAVGEYTITPTGEAAQGNYTVSFVAGTLAITPKAVTNANVTNTGTTPTITLTQDQNGTTATLDGASDGSVSITADVAVEKVILSREFGSGQKTAVCWPFAVSAEQTATLGKFYEFKGIDGDGKIEMQEVTTGLTENTPYIFEPSSDKTEIDFGAKTLKAGGPVSVSNGYTYKGIYSRVKWTTDTTDPLYNATLAGELGKAYGFALKDKTVGTTEYHKGQFVKLASGAHSRAFRAYLLYDGTWDGNQPTAAARRTTRGEGGLPDVIDIVWLAANSGTTGISSIGITHDGDAWYSLDGRKLNGKPTAKGLYIHNGRKEVVK